MRSLTGGNWSASSGTEAEAAPPDDFIGLATPNCGRPPLLPPDPVERAQVRAVAQIMACDIHPVNNLAVLNYLKGPLKHDQAAVDDWYRHWVTEGFDAIEALLRPGPYAFGANVTMADLCLVPQVFNARRFKVDMGQYSKIALVDAACLKLPAFEKARPENQLDAE